VAVRERGSRSDDFMPNFDHLTPQMRNASATPNQPTIQPAGKGGERGEESMRARRNVRGEGTNDDVDDDVDSRAPL